jgi:hypothetical protein
MNWWRCKFRSEDGKKHLWLVEADTKEEAEVFAEMQVNGIAESVEKIDDAIANPSPLLLPFK